MRRGLLAGLLLVVLVTVGGCFGSNDEADGASVSEQLTELEPRPDVELTNAGAPEHRDPAAIAAALWRLDPCRLIEPSYGASCLDENTSAPHACALRTKGYRSEVVVELGARLGPEDRFAMPAVELAGVKAYKHPHPIEYGACAVWVPVSATHSIKVENTRPRCDNVYPVVKRIVERVDDGDALRVPTLGRTDTCALLREAIDERGRRVDYGYEESYGIDSCTTVDPREPGEIQPLTPYAQLRVGIGDAETDWRESATIDGRPIYRFAYGADDCETSWAEGRTALRLEARSCATARRLTARVIAALERGEPIQSAGVEPQRPLLYERDEADLAAGSCGDYQPLYVGWDRPDPTEDVLAGPGCRTYAEPEVPDNAAEIVAAADADPTVTCAVARDAVREHYPDLRPAVLSAAAPDANPPPADTRPCVFTDPAHRKQVTVFVSSDRLPNGAHVAVYDDSGPHPILTAVDVVHGDGRLVGLGDDPNDRGFVGVYVGRRDRFGDTELGNERRLDLAHTIVDTIIDEYLS